MRRNTTPLTYCARRAMANVARSNRTSSPSLNPNTPREPYEQVFAVSQTSGFAKGKEGRKRVCEKGKGMEWRAGREGEVTCTMAETKKEQPKVFSVVLCCVGPTPKP